MVRTIFLLGIALALLLVVGAGSAYYFTRSEKEQKELRDTAWRKAIVAEIEAEKAALKALDEAIAAAKSAPAVNTSGMKLQGYDARSYGQGSSLEAQRQDHEKRLQDLQARLAKGIEN